MGAKARAWLNRGLVAAGIAAGVAMVAALPIPMLVKAALLCLGAVVGLWFAFREIPAFDPLGRVWWRLPNRSARICAITFDDGPSAATPRVVDILDRFGVKATFFVLAENARRHPEALRLLAERGHTIGMHGLTHKKVHKDSQPAVEDVLLATREALRGLGVSPAALYRPPHGRKSLAVLRAARKLGIRVWAWSRGIWDTDRPPADLLVRRATRWACAGMVLLLHDGRGDEEHPDVESMLAALPSILERLRRDGFVFATLDGA